MSEVIKKKLYLQKKNSNVRPFFLYPFLILKYTLCKNQEQSEKSEHSSKIDAFMLSKRFIDERLDIQFYFKVIQQFKYLKSTLLNYFQIQSMEYLKRFNLYNKSDSKELQKELDIAKGAMTDDLDEETMKILDLVFYFINLINSSKNDESKKLDKKILEKLNPYIREIIKKYLK